MKEEYEEYFEEAFQIGREVPFPPFLRFEYYETFYEIKEIINLNTDESTPTAWRSDAKYFLASTISNMVVAPYQYCLLYTSPSPRDRG